MEDSGHVFEIAGDHLGIGHVWDYDEGKLVDVGLDALVRVEFGYLLLFSDGGSDCVTGF